MVPDFEMAHEPRGFDLPEETRRNPYPLNFCTLLQCHLDQILALSVQMLEAAEIPRLENLQKVGQGSIIDIIF